MQKTFLKNKFGHIFGYILTDSSGNQKIYNTQQHYKGSYNVEKNLTYNQTGDVLANHNALITLLDYGSECHSL